MFSGKKEVMVVHCVIRGKASLWRRLSFARSFEAAPVKDMSFKGIWKESFTLKEFKGK